MSLPFKVFFAIGMALTVWLSLTAVPPTLPVSMSDPQKHVLGWAGLTAMLSLAAPKLPSWKLVGWLGLANLAIEALQGLVPSGRHPDAVDWAVGMAGILIVTALRNAIEVLRASRH